MARIEIFDDWGKPAYIIDIVSADPHDLYETVVSSLDYNRCVTCGKYVSQDDSVLIDSDDMEYACTKCHSAD